VSPVYGSNDDLAVYWHLPVAGTLLEHREIMCEVEGAVFGTNPGLLIVTDLRVLFGGRKLLRRKLKCSYSTSLGDIASAEAEERRRWPRKRKMGVVILLLPKAVVDEPPVAENPVREKLGPFAALLDGGEVPCELATTVWLDWRNGRLLVTDRRVLFLMGGTLRRHRVVASVALADVAAVAVIDSSVSRSWGRLHVLSRVPSGLEHGFKIDFANRGRAEEVAETIRFLVGGGSPADLVESPPVEQDELYDRVEFDHIEGGRERAEQIVGTILRQKTYLAREGPGPSGQGSA
jgi:hypothetical protein